MAPGAIIVNANAAGGFSGYAGTSQAAPHVAGAAAVAQQLALAQLGRRLTPDEFRTLMRDTGASGLRRRRRGRQRRQQPGDVQAARRHALANAIYAMGGSSLAGRTRSTSATAKSPPGATSACARRCRSSASRPSPPRATPASRRPTGARTLTTAPMRRASCSMCPARLRAAG
jgi:hypothetical protein